MKLLKSCENVTHQNVITHSSRRVWYCGSGCTFGIYAQLDCGYDCDALGVWAALERFCVNIRNQILASFAFVCLPVVTVDFVHAAGLNLFGLCREAGVLLMLAALHCRAATLCFARFRTNPKSS